jgi:hypothetical protein
MEEEYRIAPDGNYYTKKEFVLYFNGYEEWHAAALEMAEIALKESQYWFAVVKKESDRETYRKEELLSTAKDVIKAEEKVNEVKKKIIDASTKDHNNNELSNFEELVETFSTRTKRNFRVGLKNAETSRENALQESNSAKEDLEWAINAEDIAKRAYQVAIGTENEAWTKEAYDRAIAIKRNATNTNLDALLELRKAGEHLISIQYDILDYSRDNGTTE